MHEKLKDYEATIKDLKTESGKTDELLGEIDEKDKVEFSFMETPNTYMGLTTYIELYFNEFCHIADVDY